MIRSRIHVRLIVSVMLLSPTIVPNVQAAPAQVPPVYVTLWFDTEDYILPQDDDATRRLAELLTRLGIKATFKVVGEKARVLEQRGRKDVIDALLAHEIGFHSNTHSQQPTIAVYLQHAGWEDGRDEFVRREGAGVRDIRRIFGVTPTCYGQPGNAWVPQSYPALDQLGINMYLDEGNHVGIDDQPFYYCGMLHVFRMRSTGTRMELEGEGNLVQGKARFQQVCDRVRAQGGGTVSIFYHPNEWVHREFWDAVNFANGQNTPRSEWRLPRVKSAAEVEKAFEDFEQYVSFMKSQPGVRFVTASDLKALYPDPSVTRRFDPSDLLSLAQSVQKEISFREVNGVTLSGADAFSLLTNALESYLQKGEVPPSTGLERLYGPTRAFTPASARTRPSSFSWAAFADAARDVASFCHRQGHIPNEVWIGAESLSAPDFLATLGSVVAVLVTSGKPPERVPVREGKVTVDQYVAEDSPDLWQWPIFPEGFHAPKLMELAKLQAWTLKPAVLGGTRK